jgi:hypothetical protein
MGIESEAVDHPPTVLADVLERPGQEGRVEERHLGTLEFQ